MIIASYIKFAIMIIGMLATLIYLIPGIKNDDKLKKSRAGILFVCTCVAVMIVTIIEFLIYYKF